MRVNDETELVAAIDRLRALLSSPDIRAERDEVHDYFLVEEFIEGHEFAVEGVMNHGDLNVLAIFDKPDPLDGPFFEETIYVTPPVVPPETQRDDRRTPSRRPRRRSGSITARFTPSAA